MYRDGGGLRPCKLMRGSRFRRLDSLPRLLVLAAAPRVTSVSVITCGSFLVHWIAAWMQVCSGVHCRVAGERDTWGAGNRRSRNRHLCVEPRGVGGGRYGPLVWPKTRSSADLGPPSLLKNGPPPSSRRHDR